MGLWKSNKKQTFFSLYAFEVSVYVYTYVCVYYYHHRNQHSYKQRVKMEMYQKDKTSTGGVGERYSYVINVISLPLFSNHVTMATDDGYIMN